MAGESNSDRAFFSSLKKACDIHPDPNFILDILSHINFCMESMSTSCFDYISYIHDQQNKLFNVILRDVSPHFNYPRGFLLSIEEIRQLQDIINGINETVEGGD